MLSEVKKALPNYFYIMLDKLKTMCKEIYKLLKKAKSKKIIKAI